jgi:transposase
MRKVHFIAMDTHGQTTDICVKTQANVPGEHWHVATTIPALKAVIEQVPRPRKLTFEEGPMADWLWRNLKDCADETVVCDPRKNALVAKDGNKDDPIDAAKLCDLQIGGFVRAVYHPESLGRQVLKEAVALYHDRVRQRIRAANQIGGFLKRWCVIVREKDLQTVRQRSALAERLRAALGEEAGGAVVGHGEVLLSSYDQACQAYRAMHRELVRRARAEPQAVRWMAVPGIGPVRALTLLAYLDTPWRFRSKQALWKYLGIGLVQETSGNGPVYVHVERQCNRALKNAILGAAENVMMRPAGAFGRQYERWRAAGLTRRNARRSVARSLAAVLWGMWKNGAAYDPDQVGSAAKGVSN